MQAIGYYLALPFIYLISLIPFPVMYLLSDVMYVLVYHLFGYRREVVRMNLTKSFPDKSALEIIKIEKQFYHYLCDLFFETFKTITISSSKMLSHCRMNDEAIRLFKSYHEKNQSVILVLGHHGNWEWAGNAFSLQCPQKLFVIYHPLQHTYFNKLIIHMRTRFGTGLIKMKDTFREMVRMKEQVTATAFIADQSPPPEAAHWMQFLNQDTAVFKGPEVIATKLQYPVIYIHVHRERRGRYLISAETLAHDAASIAQDQLTELHVKKLETMIASEPETWLWSHRRWKQKRPL